MRVGLAVAALGGLLVLAGCGDDREGAPGDGGGEVPVSVGGSTTEPTVTAPPPAMVDVDAALRRAASLLGSREVDLPDDVRIARRGDEQLALTTDLVIGRLTAELDPSDGGELVVTAVQVETYDGVEVISVEGLLEQARQALGLPEAELDPEWRIARRGEETFMLTMDLVPGRFTVELDDDGTGTYVVTSVVVELPDGPQRIEAQR